MKVTRRAFLRSAVAGGGVAWAAARAWGLPAGGRAHGLSARRRFWPRESSVGATLRACGPHAIGAPGVTSAAQTVTWPKPIRQPVARRLADRFADLPRHFIFEYYPWYAVNPYAHWDASGRHPPVDLASNYMPALGAYDSRSATVIAQHAEWIKSVGAGAINVSWWGRGSDIDRVVPTLMDVMADHDIQVTFHLEPYTDQHAAAYARDIQYLISEYGDRRGWDCFLLLQDERGRVGPVFKSFRTILPATSKDCHGVTTPIADYAPDAVWRQQTDEVRALFAADFDHITLLADSLDVVRTVAGGFDGIAIYDNYVEPDTWSGHANDCSGRGLVFSFNANPGFDGIVERQVDPGSCYVPPTFEPPGKSYDWTQAADRDAARAASAARVAESFHTTLALQTTPDSSNTERGFFLTYLNSFNEWHEGHQFEPMKNRADLSAAEIAVGYHNPDDGSYRLKALQALVQSALES